MNGDTGGVDLSIAGVGKHSALVIDLDGCTTVARHGVGGEEVGIAITTGSHNNCVSRVALELAGNEVAADDATCTFYTLLVLDEDDVEHLAASVHGDVALLDLTVERRVGAEQQLLACLTLGIEGTRYLSATERTVGEGATIFTSERNALCYALVDDVVRYLSQTIDVGLTSTVVTALDGVVEQTIDRVTVVLIVLGSVDTALCSDGVSTARRILDAEALYLEAHFAKGGSGSTTSEA